MTLRLVHLADLHLGFRAFERSGPDGLNVRESDVALTFTRAIDDLLTQAPDVVLIAGDAFHSVRPSNHAIRLLFSQLRRLRTALPAASVVVIAGDHDTPRSTETQTILDLYQELGIHVALYQPQRFALPGGLTVTAVPCASQRQAATLEPDPQAALNVLLVHGEARLGPWGEPAIDAAAVTGFDYIALGHYHVCQQVAPRAWYAGSLDFTSTNVWGDLQDMAASGLTSKGYLLVELAAGTEPIVTFRPIATRAFLDLPALDAAGFGPAELDAALASALGAVELTGAVARLVVLNVPRDLQRAIDYKALRVFKGQAFHLQVDFRRPEIQARTWAANARQARTLNGIADQFLEARALPADVERDALRKLMQEYMAEASGAEDPYRERKTA